MCNSSTRKVSSLSEPLNAKQNKNKSGEDAVPHMAGVPTRHIKTPNACNSKYITKKNSLWLLGKERKNKATSMGEDWHGQIISFILGKKAMATQSGIFTLRSITERHVEETKDLYVHLTDNIKTCNNTK